MEDLRDNYWLGVIRDELSYSEEYLNLFDDPEECINILVLAIAFIVENKAYPQRINHYLNQIEKDYSFQKKYIAEKLEILINDLNLFEGVTDRDIDLSMTNVFDWTRINKYPSKPQQGEEALKDKSVFDHIQKTKNSKTELFVTFLKAIYGDEVDLDNTIIDFTNKTGGFAKFQSEYLSRKQNAPQWEKALSKWIAEIEYISSADNLQYEDQVSQVCYLTSFFRDIASSGKSGTLATYVDMIIDSKDLFNFEINRNYTDAIADGVVYAYKLPELEEELMAIQNSRNISSQNEEQPIKLKNTKPIWWQGTARQLGYLMDELAAKGFIDKNTNFNEAIKTHFVDKDKNPFKDSIKQNKSGTGQNKNQKPKGGESIDELLKQLPNKK